MVVAPGFRVFIGNMVTGRITADLPAASQSWGVRLNGAGPLDLTTRALSEELLTKDLRNITAEKKNYLAFAYGNTILEAGPIWKRDYSARTGVLKLGAEGLWSILDKTKALNWAQIIAGTPVTRSSLDLTGLSLGSIAREIVRLSIVGNPYNPGLPIVFPDIVETGSNERHYKGYELPYVGDLLRKLTEVQDGPDIAFRPRYNAADPTRIEWVMTHGSPSSPLLYQSGDDWIWDGSVDESGVSDIGVKSDGSRMADRVWQPGAGSELEMKLATAQDLDLIQNADYPWTEADAASKDVEDLDILQGHADYAIALARRPIETWDLTVRANTSPLLGNYSPGDFAQITVPKGNPMIAAGVRRVRLMAIDGDNTETVTLTPAPMPAGV
ncbi:hypothetical protein AU252_19735 [Pseudarthrobacter sulfonivorans]|uniref:Minor tail protein n=1 Tax=Pseudarthrobacter sulfonivorans TaxID=121292 RepID=A0A0U3FHG5_9MICC|nr:hypothetical protein [Pseudarthrobacter sulfonivorans]ALV43113.1 hypothetical protein AU252_19735 [Pseudarthrobacter sulfonivorans]